MRHVFHPEAGREFEEAVQYYRPRGRKLGERFAAEVKAVIQKMVENPERWRVLEAEVRRCVVRVFPYSVLYSIESDFILILAIAHHKRAPGYWRGRLRSKG